MKYLETAEARFLFGGLPRDVSGMLREGFLSGAHAVEIPNWDLVVNYFQTNSKIIPALTANPGTFRMLEMMYHFEGVEGIIDNYFLKSVSGGQALFSRYYAVTKRACKHVADILATNGNCLMIDIGSGPGRNGIDMCRQQPEFNGNLKIDCIDIDAEAIAKGKELINAHGINQVEFVQKSMTKLGQRYPGNVDYGLLIGILCGLDRKDRVALLRAIKPYFKKRARLVAASLLDTMLEKDLLCAYVLRETTGWGLKFPALGELEEVFEEAGWHYEGYFQEIPTRLYEIGIGVNV